MTSAVVGETVSPGGVTSGGNNVVFSQRIVCIDYVLSAPVACMDPTQAQDGSRPPRVPVLRIFGPTTAGQKTCCHVHGVLPYLTVLEDPEIPSMEGRIGAAIDEALDRALQKSSTADNSRRNFQPRRFSNVYSVVKIVGRTFYGYRDKAENFLRIYLLNPGLVKKLAQMFLAGNIFGVRIQPHEAHIPYHLQFLIDYNLYGMNLAHYKAVKFRKTCENFEKEEKLYENCDEDFDVGCGSSESIGVKSIWDAEKVGVALSSPLQKVSSCQLEVDVLAEDIANCLLPELKSGNPGIDGIWKDEQMRRRLFSSCSDEWDITMPHSDQRQYQGEKFPTEQAYFNSLMDKLQQHSFAASEVTTSGESQECREESLLPASQVVTFTSPAAGGGVQHLIAEEVAEGKESPTLSQREFLEDFEGDEAIRQLELDEKLNFEENFENDDNFENEDKDESEDNEWSCSFVSQSAMEDSPDKVPKKVASSSSSKKILRKKFKIFQGDGQFDEDSSSSSSEKEETSGEITTAKNQKFQKLGNIRNSSGNSINRSEISSGGKTSETSNFRKSSNLGNISGNSNGKDEISNVEKSSMKHQKASFGNLGNISENSSNEIFDEDDIEACENNWLVAKSPTALKSKLGTRSPKTPEKTSKSSPKNNLSSPKNFEILKFSTRPSSRETLRRILKLDDNDSIVKGEGRENLTSQLKSTSTTIKKSRDAFTQTDEISDSSIFRKSQDLFLFSTATQTDFSAGNSNSFGGCKCCCTCKKGAEEESNSPLMDFLQDDEEEDEIFAEISKNSSTGKLKSENFQKTNENDETMEVEESDEEELNTFNNYIATPTLHSQNQNFGIYSQNEELSQNLEISGSFEKSEEEELELPVHKERGSLGIVSHNPEESFSEELISENFEEDQDNENLDFLTQNQSFSESQILRDNFIKERLSHLQKAGNFGTSSQTTNKNFSKNQTLGDNVENFEKPEIEEFDCQKKTRNLGISSQAANESLSKTQISDGNFEKPEELSLIDVISGETIRTNPNFLTLKESKLGEKPEFNLVAITEEDIAEQLRREESNFETTSQHFKLSSLRQKVSGGKTRKKKVVRKCMGQLVKHVLGLKAFENFKKNQQDASEFEKNLEETLASPGPNPFVKFSSFTDFDEDFELPPPEDSDSEVEEDFEKNLPISEKLKNLRKDGRKVSKKRKFSKSRSRTRRFNALAAKARANVHAPNVFQYEFEPLKKPPSFKSALLHLRAKKQRDALLARKKKEEEGQVEISLGEDDTGQNETDLGTDENSLGQDDTEQDENCSSPEEPPIRPNYQMAGNDSQEFQNSQNSGTSSPPSPLNSRAVEEGNSNLNLASFSKSSEKFGESSKRRKLDSGSGDFSKSSFNSSEIDVGEENFGFAHDMSNLQDAKAFHQYQHLTTLSMELFTSVRGEFLPDPLLDSIQGIFLYVLKDYPDSPQYPSKFIRCFIVESVGCEANNSKTTPTTTSTPATTATTTNYYATEVELIDSFLTFVRNLDPDIFIGYETEKMSWGYLMSRGPALGIDTYGRLSRIFSKFGNNPRHFFKNDQEPWNGEITGRISLNLWRLLRHEIAVQSYTFENAMYHIMHVRVPFYQPRTLWTWWKSPLYRWRVLDFYKTRCEGNIEIVNKLDLINRTSELARLFGILFYEVFSRGSQFRVESMMLRNTKYNNFVAVSPSVAQRAKMRAPEFLPLILEPYSSYYTDPVAVLDFQSLYPSMMMAYNYDYSTVLGRVEHLTKDGSFALGCLSNEVPVGVLHQLREHIHISPAGVAFVDGTVRRGVVPEMLEQILETRQMVKRSMKKWAGQGPTLHKILDSRQLGLKLIANVTYGYTSANFSGRMPCVEIADSIVSKGRETLQRAIDLVKSNCSRWGGEVVYGDTDSLFVLFRGKSRQEAFSAAHEIAHAVTQSNPKPVKLKFEKVYQPCILQSKKRYVGYAYETPQQQTPTYDAKGIETVRRDGCPAIRKILERTLHVLFSSSSEEKVRRYVETQLKKLFSGRVSLQEFTFAREYRGRDGYKPTACVPALQIAKRLSGKDRMAEPLRKERVQYVVIYDKLALPLIKLVRTPREFLNDPRLRLNAHYYIEKAIIPPLNRCLKLAKMDANKWYKDLPRRYLRNLGREKLSRGTLDGFVRVENCVRCDGRLQSGRCPLCDKDCAKTHLHLATAAKDNLRKLHAAKQICGLCSGFEVKCSNFDCPVFHKSLRYERSEEETKELLTKLAKLDF